MSNEKKIYEREQKKADFKVGDKVKILRKAETEEKGWLNTWTKGMDLFVGKEGEVTEICGKYGIEVKLCPGNIELEYEFPYYVLEKVDG
jgi:hypothetical protein